MADLKFYKQSGISNATEGSVVFDTSDKTIKVIEGGGAVPYKGIIESSVINSSNAISSKAVLDYTIPCATPVSGLYAPMLQNNRKIFIAEDLDRLYAADKRFIVTATTNGESVNNNLAYLFDGTIETSVSFAAGTTVITIITNSSWTYGEGWLWVNAYDTYFPETVSARMKARDGWYNIEMNKVSDGANNTIFEGVMPVKIWVSEIEITITSTKEFWLQTIAYIARRPGNESSSVRKYNPETLHYNLTVPSLTINKTNFTGNASELKDFNTRIYDATYSRTANTFLAAPNGSNGAATFRKIETDDVPIVNRAKEWGTEANNGNYLLGDDYKYLSGNYMVGDHDGSEDAKLLPESGGNYSQLLKLASKIKDTWAQVIFGYGASDQRIYYKAGNNSGAPSTRSWQTVYSTSNPPEKVSSSTEITTADTPILSVGPTGELYTSSEITTNRSINSIKCSQAQIGKWRYNVASFYAPESRRVILIKTPIPFGSNMHIINIQGYTYESGQMIDLSIGWYVYNNAFFNHNVKNSGTWFPDNLYLFSYLKDNVKYVGIALNDKFYFAQFTVDYFSINEPFDYASGWTIESGTADTPLAIPTDDRVELIPKALKTSITGTAESAKTAETASQLTWADWS